MFTPHSSRGSGQSRQSRITGVTPALYRGAGGVKRAQAAENSLGGGQMADCRHWPGLASTQARRTAKNLHTSSGLTNLSKLGRKLQVAK